MPIELMKTTYDIVHKHFSAYFQLIAFTICEWRGLPNRMWRKLLER